MDSTTRSVIAAVIAIVIVLIVIWTMPTYKLEPKGIMLPSIALADQKPFTGQVKLYDPLTAPFSYKSVGIVHVAYHTNTANQADVEAVNNKVKQLVSSIGGNAAIKDQQMTGLTMAPAPLQSYVYTGQAIAQTN